tara:strand:+ start:4678 stop:9078 length:4401 start_codon:yes stop_codon:yes gene_type:complete
MIAILLFIFISGTNAATCNYEVWGQPWNPTDCPSGANDRLRYWYDSGYSQYWVEAYDNKLVALGSISWEFTLQSNAFACCTGFTSIAMPSGSGNKIVSIGSSAFRDSTVTSFDGCCASDNYGNSQNGLTYVKSVQSYAFMGSDLQSVSFSTHLHSIGNRAFLNAASLTSLSIESGGTGSLVIGYFSFGGTALTSVSLPSQTARLDDYAFYNVDTLTTVTIAGGSEPLSIGANVFRGTSLTSIHIPSRTYETENEVFYESGTITSITIDGGTLGNTICQSCSALDSVTLGSGVTEVGGWAFRYSTVKTVVFGAEALVGYSTFQECTELTSMTIQTSVKRIPPWFCYACTSLTEVIIPGSVETIDYMAFANIGPSIHIYVWGLGVSQPQGNYAWMSWRKAGFWQDSNPGNALVTWGCKQSPALVPNASPTLIKSGGYCSGLNQGEIGAPDQTVEQCSTLCEYWDYFLFRPSDSQCYCGYYTDNCDNWVEYAYDIYRQPKLKVPSHDRLSCVDYCDNCGPTSTCSSDGLRCVCNFGYYGEYCNDVIIKIVSDKNKNAVSGLTKSIDGQPREILAIDRAVLQSFPIDTNDKNEVAFCSKMCQSKNYERYSIIKTAHLNDHCFCSDEVYTCDIVERELIADGFCDGTPEALMNGGQFTELDDCQDLCMGSWQFIMHNGGVCYCGGTIVETCTNWMTSQANFKTYRIGRGEAQHRYDGIEIYPHVNITNLNEHLTENGKPLLCGGTEATCVDKFVKDGTSWDMNNYINGVLVSQECDTVVDRDGKYMCISTYSWNNTGIGAQHILGSGYTSYTVATQQECFDSCETNGFLYSSFATNSVSCRCSQTIVSAHPYGYGMGVYVRIQKSLAGCISATIPGTTRKVEAVPKQFSNFNSTAEVIHDKEITETYYTLWFDDPTTGWAMVNVTGEELLQKNMETDDGIFRWALPCVAHTEFYDTSHDLGHAWKYYHIGGDNFGQQEWCDGYVEPSTEEISLSNGGYPDQYDSGTIQSTPPGGQYSQPIIQTYPGTAPFGFSSTSPSVCTGPLLSLKLPGKRFGRRVKWINQGQYPCDCVKWEYSGACKQPIQHIYCTNYGGFVEFYDEYKLVDARKGDPSNPGRCKPSKAFFHKVFQRVSEQKGCSPSSYSKPAVSVFPSDIECTKTYTNVCDRPMGCNNCISTGVSTEPLFYERASMVPSNGKCTKCKGFFRHGEGCSTLILRDYTYEREDCQPHYFVAGLRYKYSEAPQYILSEEECISVAPKIGKRFVNTSANDAPKGCHYNGHNVSYGSKYTFQTSDFPTTPLTETVCLNYSLANGYSYQLTTSNSVPFGCSKWETSIFYKAFNSSLSSVECGAIFSTSNVMCVVERNAECSFQYGCIGQEGESDFRYLYNPQTLPQTELIPNSNECEEFSDIIDKDFRLMNDTSKPFGCYMDLGHVRFNLANSTVLTTYVNDESNLRLWEVRTISILKNGYKST